MATTTPRKKRRNSARIAASVRIAEGYRASLADVLRLARDLDNALTIMRGHVKNLLSAAQSGREEVYGLRVQRIECVEEDSAALYWTLQLSRDLLEANATVDILTRAGLWEEMLRACGD